MTTLELTGLKGHHPLGFLAACGLLRCCNMVAGLGTVKLAWDAVRGTREFVAELQFKEDYPDSHALKERIINLLVHSADKAIQAGAFSWSKKIRVTRTSYREAARKVIDQRHDDDVAFLACFASELVMSKKGKLTATAFDMTSAKQEFLALLGTVARSLGSAGDPLPLKRDGSEGMQSPPPRAAFEEALYGPWRYRDNVHSHGRDPATQRLHALMGISPNVGREKQGIPGVRAAIFLGSQALPLFPCFAVGRKLCTTGFHRDKGDEWFAWPIWREPISLDTLRSLLAHPFTNDLKRRGVEVVYRCRRVRTGGSEGYYYVFSHPEKRPWPSRQRRRTAGSQASL